MKGFPVKNLGVLDNELEGVRQAVVRFDWDPEKIAAYVYERASAYVGAGHEAWTRQLIAEAINATAERRATEAYHAARSAT